MLTKQEELQLEYAAKTNKAVRKLLAEYERLRAQVEDPKQLKAGAV